MQCILAVCVCISLSAFTSWQLKCFVLFAWCPERDLLEHESETVPSSWDYKNPMHFLWGHFDWHIFLMGLFTFSLSEPFPAISDGESFMWHEHWLSPCSVVEMMQWIVCEICKSLRNPVGWKSIWDYCHSVVTPIYTVEIANAARWKEDERCDELFTTLKWPASARESVIYSTCHWNTCVMGLHLRKCQYERQGNDLSTGYTQ